MAQVRVESLVKRYGKVLAVDDVSFQISNGEFVTLLGPSGCGKTTLLKVLAGLLQPDEGKVFFDDKEMGCVPSNERNVGLVFQNYALFPHMSVFQNIAFGLQMKRRPTDEIEKRVKEVLSLVDMSGYDNRYPAELSGGQQQRVAVARALAFDPDVLLLDEPLSNLDAKLRESVRLELRTLQKETGKTTIFVTHDQVEALTMSDRIILMNNGGIEQVGSPGEIYNGPRTTFAADFIGINNFLDATIIARDSTTSTLRIAGDSESVLTIKNDASHIVKGSKNDNITEVKICIRPEELKPLHPGDPEEHLNTITGRLIEKVFTGPTYLAYVEVHGSFIKVQLSQEEASNLYPGENYTFFMSDCVLIPK